MTILLCTPGVGTGGTTWGRTVDSSVSANTGCERLQKQEQLHHQFPPIYSRTTVNTKAVRPHFLCLIKSG